MIRIYAGEFLNGSWEGYGVQFDNKGQKMYEGYWKDDKRQGKGTEYDKHGKVTFIGMWNSNLKERETRNSITKFDKNKKVVFFKKR